MTKQTVAAKQAADIDDDREVIEVDPRQVQMQSEGQVYREWVIHLPEGADKSDLQTPSIWKRVQGDRSKSLIIKDKLTIFSSDESWFCEARVWKADRLGAHLRFSKISEFREASADLWSDEFHELKFETGHYFVYDKRSGARKFAQGFLTEESARTACIASYPKAVGM
ncbi:hypothetical protein [Roseibium salinum]|uniref:Uncharacterized protein n=1 Tax=Roseibium salinum TaxID=1604349 RepID=A0ABT3QYE3_9HYPH|nr:hypothetical protein [Roseibium sp. DSM 29163]MCX2721968.1 hypothetical protein [Roseibium sp. DSM 29163]